MIYEESWGRWYDGPSCIDHRPWFGTGLPDERDGRQ
jgi:hypothetical protein